MKACTVAVLALVTLALLTQVLTASPGAPTGVIIQDADNDWDFALMRSASLVGATQSVARRVVVNDAKSVFRPALAQMPVALRDLINAVRPGVFVQYSNSLYLHTMAPIPAELRNLVEQMASRIWLDHANVILEHTLGYPRELFSDTAAPALSGITLERERGVTATIAWNTDEYADSTIRFGAAPGQYTRTAQDPLYVKRHAVTLSGLTPGATYYFTAASVDRSGNAAVSAEYHFRTSYPVYLPAVLRRR